MLPTVPVACYERRHTHGRAWSLDGRRIAFASDRTGSWEVLWSAADGTGEPEVLASFDGDAIQAAWPFAWSPDGTRLLVVVESETGRDIGTVDVDGAGTWEPLIQTEADELHPAVAPNGQLSAYTSDETGALEVYVERYPDLGDRRLVSVGGGINPLWSPDGRELPVWSRWSS